LLRAIAVAGCPWDAAIVHPGAEKDELALHHVLGLQPVLGWTAAVEAFRPLGDDALQPELGGMLEEQSTIAISMIAELDGRAAVQSGSISFRSAALLSMRGLFLRSSPSRCRRSKAKNTTRWRAL